MRACAEASEAELYLALAELGDLPAREKRSPETGLVMLRACTGGSGAAFDLGETTVTRAALRLETGVVGVSYLLGRSPRRATGSGPGLPPATGTEPVGSFHGASGSGGGACACPNGGIDVTGFRA
jgi:hypothetical protein